MKCPLHGKIIARDNMGRPADVRERMRLEDEEMEERYFELNSINLHRVKQKKNPIFRYKNPDWQDPELLRDLKASTGIDLKIPKKFERRKKKENGEKRGLTDLNKVGNLARKRLEKKVFNKSSMKRVAERMNK